MGYADYLKQMLKPLGVYNLTSGYGNAELEAVGDALDKVCAVLDNALSGSTYTDTDGEYLKMFESLFPIVNFGETEEERRENVLTLLSVNDNMSDEASLEALLKACGLEAEITETDNKFTVELHFTKIRGELSDEEIQVCRAVMPSHIAMKFICDGLTWDRAEELFPTFDNLDGAGLCIRDLVKLI